MYKKSSPSLVPDATLRRLDFDLHHHQCGCHCSLWGCHWRQHLPADTWKTRHPAQGYRHGNLYFICFDGVCNVKSRKSATSREMNVPRYSNAIPAPVFTFNILFLHKRNIHTAAVCIFFYTPVCIFLFSKYTRACILCSQYHSLQHE